MTTDTFKVSSSGKATIKKDKDSSLDYSYDWTEWLDLINDNISPPPNDPVFLVDNGITVGTPTLRNGTRGTGKNYKTDSAGYAVGTAQINVAGGSGTILANDIVSFDGDLDDNGKPRFYLVDTGLSGGSIILASPGLKQALPASAVAVTVRAIVTVKYSGGNPKAKANATCRINTVGGRIEDRSITLKITER